MPDRLLADLVVECMPARLLEAFDIVDNPEIAAALAGSTSLSLQAELLEPCRPSALGRYCLADFRTGFADCRTSSELDHTPVAAFAGLVQDDLVEDEDEHVRVLVLVHSCSLEPLAADVLLAPWCVESSDLDRMKVFACACSLSRLCRSIESVASVCRSACALSHS